MNAENNPAKPKSGKLRQSLKDTRELLHLRIKECEALKKELLFWHNTHLKRSGSVFHYLFDQRFRMLLLSAKYDTTQPNIIVYIPQQELEIAKVNVKLQDDVLVIQELKIDFDECDVQVGAFILKELILRATSEGASKIIGNFFASEESLDFLENFYRQVGFTVTGTDLFEETGSLLYQLK